MFNIEKSQSTFNAEYCIISNEISEIHILKQYNRKKEKYFFQL